MMKNILALAAERAIQLAQFANSQIRLDGEPVIEGYTMHIPVKIGYADLSIDPLDPEVLPEVDGSVLVDLDAGEPVVQADFGQLGQLRREWDARHL